MGIEKKITEMLVTASCGDQKQIAETIAKEMGLVLDGRPITISFKMSIFDEVVDVETAHATIECLVDWINHRLETKTGSMGIMISTARANAKNLKSKTEFFTEEKAEEVEKERLYLWKPFENKMRFIWLREICNQRQERTVR